MPVKLIGRESHFHGKSLYEIARNLKNFGEGRYVYRCSFTQRYKEPSFYKLTSVVPEMNAANYSRGTAVGEKIFRGKNYGICNIDAGMKHDWRLIPKDQEQSWIDSVKNIEVKPPIAIERNVRLPPLMESIFHGDLLADGIEIDPKDMKCEVFLAKGKFCTPVILQDSPDGNSKTKNQS